MTLEELKIKIYSLIEEYDENAEELTNDPDFSAKMNHVINQIQNELARFKKINAYLERQVTENEEITLEDIDKNLYQMNTIRGVDFETIGDRIIFTEEGTAKIYYYKYPKQIGEETEDDYVFELSRDVLEIMPYGVAGDLLKSDVSSQYGTIYSARYREMIKELDPRNNSGSVYMSGGCD